MDFLPDHATGQTVPEYRQQGREALVRRGKHQVRLLGWTGSASQVRRDFWDMEVMKSDKASVARLVAPIRCTPLSVRKDIDG